MEMLTTGMIDEHQVWAINNLHEKRCVDKNTIFIPKKQSTFVALTEKKFEDFGFNIRMVRHLWSWLPNSGMKFLSEKKLLNSISFSQINDLDFKAKVSFEVKEDGTVNSIHFSSLTTIDESTEVGDTLALNAPVVFPLDEDYLVHRGDKFEVEISYTFGSGYRNLNIKKI
jgi:predicted RNA methylase